MEKIMVGVIGTGFIGPVHIEAIRRQAPRKCWHCLR